MRHPKLKIRQYTVITHAGRKVMAYAVEKFKRNPIVALCSGGFVAIADQCKQCGVGVG